MRKDFEVMLAQIIIDAENIASLARTIRAAMEIENSAGEDYVGAMSVLTSKCYEHIDRLCEIMSNCSLETVPLDKLIENMKVSEVLEAGRLLETLLREYEDSPRITVGTAYLIGVNQGGHKERAKRRALHK